VKRWQEEENEDQLKDAKKPQAVRGKAAEDQPRWVQEVREGHSVEYEELR